MYCDLDKVDIVYERNGEQIGVQTDHRAAEDIEADLPRTLVFALCRIIQPFGSELGLSAMECAYEAMPPARLREAVEVAGARLRVGEGVVEPLAEPDDARADEIAALALEEVGRGALARRGLEATEAGLHALEAQLGLDAEYFDDWLPEQLNTAILELGAAAGEVMRAVHGGVWVRDHYFEQDIPFTVNRDGSRTNLFGRARRFFEESVDEGPSILMKTATEGPSDGPILPVLRHRDFAGGPDAAPTGRPLVEVEGVEGIPHIYLVQDRPESVMYLGEQPREDFDVLLEASYQNLARVPASVERLQDDLPIYLLEGDYFATSKILDRTTLAGLAETVESERLMVAVPTTRTAVVAPMWEDPSLVASFLALVEDIHDAEGQSVQLSRHAFLATPEGGVIGLIRLTAEEDEEA